MNRSHVVLNQLEREQGGWRFATLDVLHSVASRRGTLTADDLWPLVPFPTGTSGGRLMGWVIAEGLRRRWLDKDKCDGFWKAIDHVDLPIVRSADGIVITRKTVLPVYRSLIRSAGG